MVPCVSRVTNADDKKGIHASAMCDATVKFGFYPVIGDQVKINGGTFGYNFEVGAYAMLGKGLKVANNVDLGIQVCVADNAMIDEGANIPDFAMVDGKMVITEPDDDEHRFVLLKNGTCKQVAR